LLIATSLVFASQLLSEFVLGADVVLLLGAKIESEILAGEYWRFITPVFIHAGFLHSSPYPSVGASGAIFGLLGSLGVFLYQNRSTLGPAAALQLRRIVLIAILNLALGLSPGIDNWGHVGGLIFGAGLAWFIGPLLQVRATESGRRVIIDQRQWNQIWPQMATGVGVLAILAIATII
jgi:rhomboid protease GluP